MIQTFFKDTAAAGWKPVDPCTDPRELTKLEACYARGTCCFPIIHDGDILYFDRSARAQHGDIVVFNLSSRAVEALNSALDPGAEPWRVGGPYWVKLLAAPSPRAEFLVCNGGDLVTASFMSSEFPTDDPPIWPVKNVWRNGKMLFGAAPHLVSRRGVLTAAIAGLALTGCDAGGVNIPELPPVTETSDAAADTAQLGDNAATAIFTGSAGSTTLSTSAFTPAVSFSIGPYPYATSVVMTTSGSWQFITGANPDGAVLALFYDMTGTVGVNGIQLCKDPTITYQPASQTRQQSFAGEYTYALPAGTTATFDVSGIGGWSQPTTSTAKLIGVTLKCEVIKR